MRVGRVVAVEEFPEARVPAWKLTIDFGPDIGIKRSSAQITHYPREQLEGSLVVGVVNLAPRVIARFKSEVLVLGALDETWASCCSGPTRTPPSGRGSPSGTDPRAGGLRPRGATDHEPAARLPVDVERVAPDPETGDQHAGVAVGGHGERVWLSVRNSTTTCDRPSPETTVTWTGMCAGAVIVGGFSAPPDTIV